MKAKKKTFEIREKKKDTRLFGKEGEFAGARPATIGKNIFKPKDWKPKNRNLKEMGKHQNENEKR